MFCSICQVLKLRDCESIKLDTRYLMCNNIVIPRLYKGSLTTRHNPLALSHIFFMPKAYQRKLLRIGSRYKSSAVSIPKEILDKALSEEVDHTIVSIKLDSDSSPDIVSVTADFIYKGELD